MKILVAPDSFKGSLEAYQICDIVEQAVHEIFPHATVAKLPMADGGEGTVFAVLSTLKGEEITVSVNSPDFRMIKATYGFVHNAVDGNQAIMEMAEASGITKVEKRDILKMNTYGTGEMVLDAIHRGVKTIYIGIGGSATNDCGLGFASALGVRFLDAKGHELMPIPENFLHIARIDDSAMKEEVRKTNIVVMCDVKNPLLGKTGATHVFGRQKGATDETIPLLEQGMTHFGQLLEKTYGAGIINKEGAGAAGGLGAAMLAIVGAKMQSGITTILNILDFDRHIEDVDLVITGEGRMDYQSAFGKVPFGVGSKCKKRNIPCIALVGGLGERYEELYAHGITSIMTTIDGIMSLEEAIKNAERLCYQATIRALRMINIETRCL